MAGGTQVNEDQNLKMEQVKAEKAKPVAVDPKSKEVAQAGKLTPEERVKAVDELIPQGHTIIRVDSKRGTIVVHAAFDGGAKGDELNFQVKLVSHDTNRTMTIRTGHIAWNGNFIGLTREIHTRTSNNNYDFLQPKITQKETISSEWAEKFTDGLIKDALKAKAASKQ